MAQLRDMEELIGRIDDTAMQNYMREAMRCYMTDAHRACIIMSFIAIYENIYFKLDRLAIINKTAKEIFEEIKEKKESQEVFEKEMVDRLLKATIINKLDVFFLDILRDLRNKSAHPSGHSPSAEEARYVFSESISRFLSKPILSAHQIADEIISSLSGGNLFPTLKITDYSIIVNHETSKLTKEALPYLLNKLITRLDDTNEKIKLNALRFILGLCHDEKDDYKLDNLRKIIIEKQASKTEREKCIISAIACNHKLLEKLSDPAYIRLNKILIKNSDNADETLPFNKLSNPLQTLKSISKLHPDFAKEKFNLVISALLLKFKYNTDLITIIKRYSWLKDEMFKIFLDMASAYNFKDANDFAKYIIPADEKISELFDSSQCFSLIVGIYKSSTYNANQPEKIVESGFNSIKKIKSKALSGLPEKIDEYQKIITKISNDTDLKIDDIIYKD